MKISRRKRSRVGFSLVITLLVLVLIAGIVLAVFSASTLQRSISNSSSGQIRAEFIAQTGMDTIVSDLVAEIVAGSEANPATNGAYLPRKPLAAAPYYTVGATLTNLVKTSEGGLAFWQGTNYVTNGPVRAAAGADYLTTAAATDGRFLPIAAWNKPMLLGSMSNFTAPSWIFVTRNGAISNATALPPMSELANRALTNSNHVIGRYAYTIYDEGGLIDINVAGNALDAVSTTGGYDNARRGRMHQAAIGQIPGISQPGDLVAWRSETSKNATNWLFASTNSFLQVPASSADQTFVSRQDLIAYVKANPGVISTNALQYLGTFSRETNAPTFIPDPSRPKVSTGPVGNPNTVGLDDSFNPPLATIPDGSGAFGKFLVKQRFPLSRLSWITSDGPAAGASAADIKTYFGMTWDGAGHQWIYTSPDGSTAASQIKLLASPGASNNIPSARAQTTGPDFFELLQAAIHIGSLGRDAGPAADPAASPWVGSGALGLYNDVQSTSQNTYLNVLQIGANILTQAQTSIYPIAIAHSLNGTINQPVFGVVPYPYVSRMISVGLQKFHDEGTQMILEFEVWNPHQAPAISTADYPTRFRIRPDPDPARKSVTQIRFGSPGYIHSPYSGTFTMSPSASIQFPSSGTASPSLYSEPTLLSSSNAQLSGGGISTTGYCVNLTTGLNSSADLFGLNAGFFKPTPSASAYSKFLCIYHLVPKPELNFVLEYEKNGNWHPYGRVPRITSGGLTYQPFEDLAFPNNNDEYSNLNPQNGNKWYKHFYGQGRAFLQIDPRTSRFGMMGRNTYLVPMSKPAFFYTTSGQTLRPSGALGENISVGVNGAYTTSPAFVLSSTTVGGTKGVFIESIADNLTTSPNYYVDPDGVARPGAGAYQTSLDPTAIDGRPLSQGANRMSRPIVLNRPLRSVGELGYVFRDQPWKNLDFSHPTSGDSALLDVFSIDDAPIVGGKINLNSRNIGALQATISGAILDEIGNSTVSGGTTGDAASIAQALVQRTSDSTRGPLASKAELVSKFSADLDSGYSASTDRIIRSHREAAIRALADVGTTRTWNLLIDIVAQSGRFPPHATSPSQFVVNGEKRYWLHLAIDRFTGKVIAQYIEPVAD